MTNPDRPVCSDPSCLHPDAYKVNSSVIPGLIYRCWCPDCEKPLRATFRYPCCGGEPGSEPGEGHVYNCAGKAPLAPPPATPAPRPQRAPAYRPPRRRRLAPVLFPVLAAAFIAGVYTVARLNPAPPDPRGAAADAAVCQAWFTQGVHVPEGSGVSYMGDYVDPGYAKLTAAEDALDPLLGGSTSPDLAAGVQQWEADMESSYIIVHGNWGFESIGSDKAAVSGFCKSNGYR